VDQKVATVIMAADMMNLVVMVRVTALLREHVWLIVMKVLAANRIVYT